MSEPRSINELNDDLFQPEEVDRFSDPVAARKKAMDYLARREYGQQELEQKLANAGFDADVAADAVAKLSDEGLQDDGRFAAAFVQSRIGQGKGPVRIREELRQKGLPDGVIDAGIEDAEQDWYALALNIRQRKFGPELPADFPEKARQMRFLQYRGFEQEHIQEAVSTRGDAAS